MSPSRLRYLTAQAALTGKPQYDKDGFLVALPPRKKRVRTESKRPAFGSQEWAETRGDDLGLSLDR